MGRSRFLPILLVAALLALSVSSGYGRRLVEEAELEGSSVQFEETEGRSSRMMIEVMDYPDPVANTNPATRAALSPPPPSQV